jgi:hypothetical protein
MIDPIKILQRAWHILWSYRALWVFGLILALTAGGSYNGGGNNGVQWREDGNQNGYQTPPPESMRDFFDQLDRAWQRLREQGIPEVHISAADLTVFLWIVGTFIVLMLLMGIAFAIARYVSETAVIRMVDEYENTGTKMTVAQGLRLGWSRTAWRLFLINLIANLPFLILFLVAILLAASFYLTVSNGGSFNFISIATMAGIAFFTIFGAIILSILLRLLRHFFWRVCVLENLGVRDSLKKGFALVRENWKSVGLMWLVMIGLGIAWVIVSIIAIIVTLPVVLVTCVISAMIVAIPGLLLAGLFSLFLSGPLLWIAAGLFVLPLFFILAFSPWVLLGSWQSVFTSSVWTLTYREIKALPAIVPQMEAVPAEG